MKQSVFSNKQRRCEFLVKESKFEKETAKHMITFSITYLNRVAEVVFVGLLPQIFDRIQYNH